MKITTTLSDSAVLEELGRRVAHRRVEAGFTQEELAREAGVSKRTVERLEAGNSVQLTSFVRLLRTLGVLAGFEALLPPATPGPMDLLRRGGQRQRVKSGAKPAAKKPWQWGSEE